MRWYKRDCDAALVGMIGLTLAERGIYNTILDLLYSRDGEVPDNDTFMLRHLGCHSRTWKAIKSSLISKGKIWVADGRWHAKRVEKTIAEAREFSFLKPLKRPKSYARAMQEMKKPNKNNDRPRHNYNHSNKEERERARDLESANEGRQHQHANSQPISFKDALHRLRITGEQMEADAIREGGDDLARLIADRRGARS
jgi:uncharacterized protein YdaU (DUF1376 family)